MITANAAGLVSVRCESVTRLQRVLSLELCEEGAVFFGGGMGGAEFAAGGIGGASGEFLGFGKFALAGEVAGKIVTGFESFRMVGAAELVEDAKEFAIFGLSGIVFGLIKEGVGQAAMGASRHEMVLPEDASDDRQKVAEHALCFGVVLLGHEGVGETVAVHQSVWMFATKNLFFERDDFAILSGGFLILALGLKGIRKS